MSRSSPIPPSLHKKQVSTVPQVTATPASPRTLHIPKYTPHLPDSTTLHIPRLHYTQLTPVECPGWWVYHSHMSACLQPISCHVILSTDDNSTVCGEAPCLFLVLWDNLICLWSAADCALRKLLTHTEDQTNTSLSRFWRVYHPVS